MSEQALAYEVVSIGPVRVRWREEVVFVDAHTRREIEMGWERARRESAHLFNGTFLRCLSVSRGGDGCELGGAFAEYKLLMAKRMGLDLRVEVAAIGVSGMTLVRAGGVEGVVFAERAAGVTQYAGRLEMTPSGTIGREAGRPGGVVDFEAVLLGEFAEEMGLRREAARWVIPFAVVKDCADLMYDIGCVIFAAVSEADIFEGFERVDEYRNPRLVPCAALAAFVKEEGDRLVPTSAGLIAAYLNGGRVYVDRVLEGRDPWTI